MNLPRLEQVTVKNFRSIKGSINVPLNANIVLIHGENGSGKTSLLGAIELALTGSINSLERIESNYKKELLHRSARDGEITAGEIQLLTNDVGGSREFTARLTSTEVTVNAQLPLAQASFFRDRCYLAQALLGTLLSIYQHNDGSATNPSSPLARFVSELLGLDRLDAVEEGLAPIDDTRNFRKLSERYGSIEQEQKQLASQLTDFQKTLLSIGLTLTSAIQRLNEDCKLLDIETSFDTGTLNQALHILSSSSEENTYTQLHDLKLRLEAISREANRDSELLQQNSHEILIKRHGQALDALKQWQGSVSFELEQLRTRIDLLLPNSGFELEQLILPEYQPFIRERLLKRIGQLTARIASSELGQKKLRQIDESLPPLLKLVQGVDDQISQLTVTSGRLGTLLTEVQEFVTSDKCPVCDQAFNHEGQGTLHDHILNKVRAITASATLLTKLSREQASHRNQIDNLTRERGSVQNQVISEEEANSLKLTIAGLDQADADCDRMTPAMRAGVELATQETEARRAVADYHSRDLARKASLETLSEFAATLNQSLPENAETVQAFSHRLLAEIENRISAQNVRRRARTDALSVIKDTKTILLRRSDLIQSIADLKLKADHLAELIRRAESIRSDAKQIKKRVSSVRSRIIGREFNERLNRLWRDLFVRLAPQEQYVPAFRIPEGSTRRLNPTLVTLHRSGNLAGAPGAMLSAGNLNTAALTLFLALHLTARPQLPWLILDDPVQSMDDVHVAHFAALLRTISKEHHRQVIVAVHNRQLFDYLSLELSPAFQGDSLRTVELSRIGSDDTRCAINSFQHKEEPFLP